MRFLILLMMVLARPVVAQTGGFVAVAEAMEAQDWDSAYRLAEPLGEVPHTLVTWTRLREGAGSLPEYTQFLAAYGDWPGLERLRREGERAIGADAAPDAVLRFFDGAVPLTGEGAVALARAMGANGQAEDARAMLAQVWREVGLDEDGYGAMIAAYPDVLAPHHAARADAMLWRWRTTDVGQMLDVLSPDQRTLAEARIALLGGSAVPAVTGALADHPGLANARFNRLAQRGDYSAAIALVMARTGSAEALGEPFRWASWRASLARWLMRQGRGAEAYALAAQHQLTGAGREAGFYADLEWIAGYVSLRGLNDPAQALRHFEVVAAAVDSPISVSRAAYWRGRALDDLGREEEATAAYLEAAQHQTAFYGLVASDHLGLSMDPAIAGREVFPDWRGAAFMGEDLAVAAMTLLDAGERGRAVLFVAALAQSLERQELGQLGDMLMARDEPWLTVLVGKTAVARGIVIPAHYFPLHDLAQMALPVDASLALSIARRESEFNYTVGSPVGALGLMQLMPATAEEVAGQMGLGYSRGRLTADWRYNAQLGSQYLADLTEMFGDSPVMIAAGYNAGPSRPRTWMAERGDPRRGDVDVIDWIEMIPFTETRNYVMRVTESIPVYEARLTGQVGPVRFMDLLLGRPAMLRPRMRPDGSGAPLRPEARP